MNLSLSNSGKLQGLVLDQKLESILLVNSGIKLDLSTIFLLFSVNLLHYFTTDYKTEMKKFILLVPKHPSETEAAFELHNCHESIGKR
jgi:hypothetical protein